MDDSEPQGSIPTNIRLLSLLEELARNGAPATPTELNERLGLPKPTVHRLCATLEEHGFLTRDIDGRRYSPGRRLRALAAGVLSSLRVRAARLAILTALSEEIGETCNIAIPERDGMIYLDRVETKWPLRIQLPVGTKVPLHCTAGGKLYLASMDPGHAARLLSNMPLDRPAPGAITDPEMLAKALEGIRAQGYSTDNEEFMEGMIAVAVPILNQEGRMFASLAFHAPTQRMDLPTALTHLERLRSAARELSLLVAEEPETVESR